MNILWYINCDLVIKIIKFSYLSYIGENLSAKELLKIISPEYHTPKLPPGFPTLELIQTNRFNYKTSKDYDRVSALLPIPVDMYPDYVQLSNVGINFTYSKTGHTNGTWQVDVQGKKILNNIFAFRNLNEILNKFNTKLLPF